MDLALAAVGPAIQPCDLGGEGEIDFGALEWAAKEGALLQAAMAFFDLGAFRGKRRSGGAGAQVSGGGLAGCL